MCILCLNHIGELQLFFYFTHYHPLPHFLFKCLSLLTVPISFLGCLYIYSLCQSKEDSTFSLIVIPWQDLCLYTPLALSALMTLILNVSIALKALLNLNIASSKTPVYYLLLSFSLVIDHFQLFGSSLQCMIFQSRDVS